MASRQAKTKGKKLRADGALQADAPSADPEQGPQSGLPKADTTQADTTTDTSTQKGLEADTPPAVTLQPISLQADGLKATTRMSKVPKADIPQADTPQPDTPQADTPRSISLQADGLKATTRMSKGPKADVPQADTPRPISLQADGLNTTTRMSKSSKAHVPQADTPQPDTPNANGRSADTPDSKTSEAQAPDNTRSLLPVRFGAQNLAIDPELEPIAESIRHIVARSQFGRDAALPHRIAVVASMPGEGVTTMSSMLSSVLSSDFGVQTCRVDLSWGSSSNQGVVDIVSGAAELDDVLEWEGLAATLHSGVVAKSDRHRLARSEDLDRLINELTARFHHVILDMPSILSDSEGLAMMRFADAYLLVVKHGVTTLQQVQTATEQLSDTEVLGTVINHVRNRTPRLLSRWLEG